MTETEEPTTEAEPDENFGDEGAGPEEEGEPSGAL
jgi:hypothetical protein